MMTSRLADKDELIASLLRQITEPPKDSDMGLESDTGDA
ncbi:hypothetical protein IMCC3135_17055 [Granulosicoccus antarcticus IMCC3135]|uniref:Uncharacterized protein n=1 Tax=Granulosicoccus antarcticus IMCC3135 TaxID=1192854 RepID=A0A2Z2NQ94_9GAMM|nr:hypothetical protein IMCC3135_17055 [Granulosicoccus antarcticus IMCC3135]